MALKISGHVNITNPKTMGYPYMESLQSFAELCDEVIVVDGGTTDGSLKEIGKVDKVRIIEGEKWGRNFDWKLHGKNLQIGYENCKGDWVFHFDLDYIFHEDDIDKIKEEIEKCHLPAIEVKKINFVKINEIFTKGYFPLLLNKKEYPALAYGIGLDQDKRESATFLRPIGRSNRIKNEDGLYEGMSVKMDTCRVCRTEVPIYTYDFSFMTKEQIIEQRYRFENSLQGFLGNDKRFTKKSAYNKFILTMQYRNTLIEKKIKPEGHSKFIRDKVKNIKESQFAYNGFGEL